MPKTASSSRPVGVLKSEGRSVVNNQAIRPCVWKCRPLGSCRSTWMRVPGDNPCAAIARMPPRLTFVQRASGAVGVPSSVLSRSRACMGIRSLERWIFRVAVFVPAMCTSCRFGCDLLLRIGVDRSVPLVQNECRVGPFYLNPIRFSVGRHVRNSLRSTARAFDDTQRATDRVGPERSGAFAGYAGTWIAKATEASSIGASNSAPPPNSDSNRHPWPSLTLDPANGRVASIESARARPRARNSRRTTG